MVKKNYNCGYCLRSIAKTSASVLCKGNCVQWFHLKCTDLANASGQELKNSGSTWECKTCKGGGFDSEYEESLDCDSSKSFQDLVQELESVNLLAKTLNQDLNKAYDEIQSLKEEKTQLQSMVLRKEEEIVCLEDRIKTLQQKKKHSMKEIKVPKNGKRYSLPMRLYSESVTGDSSVPMENQFKIQCTNRFEALTVVDIEDSSDKLVGRLGSYTVEQNQTEEEKIKKTLLCADSHGKELIWFLSDGQKSKDCYAFVTPGGRSEQVLNMANIEKEITKKDDCLIVMCGTNDVARNESQSAISNITRTLEKVKNSKIILVDLPNRYDLAEWSCVNEETRKVNKCLKNLSENYANVSLVEVSRADRQLHTKHGMHLNRKGKSWLAEQILQAMQDLCNSNTSAELTTSQQVCEEFAPEPTRCQSPAVETRSSSSNTTIRACTNSATATSPGNEPTPPMSRYK